MGNWGHLLLAALLAVAVPQESARAQSAGDPLTQLEDQLTQLSDILAGVSVSEVAADPDGNIYIVVDDSGQSSILEIDAAGNVSDFPGTTLPPDATPIDVDALLAELLAEVGGTGLGSDPTGTTPPDPTDPTDPPDPSTTTTGTTTPSSTGTAGTGSVAGASSPSGHPAAAAAAAVPIYTFTTPDNQGFSSPHDVAIDAQGNQYVADTDDSMITKVTPFGDESFLGSGWNGPEGVAVDAAGVVYVVDTGNDRICKITTAGQVVTIGDSSNFAYPTGVAVDAAGNVYVADPGNERIAKITPAGVFSVFAGQEGQPGHTDGPVSSATFSNPTGIAIDKAGNFYIADQSNSAIRKITAKGVVSTLVSTDGTNSLQSPTGVAVDAAGNVFAADYGNNSIYEITPKGAFLVVGSSGANAISGFSDGTADEAEFDGSFGIAVDANDNIYVADSNNNVIRIGLLNHPASYLATGSFQVGQEVALNLENAAGTQFIYYAIQSGNAVIGGEDSNIVVFQGGGPVTVSTGDFTITDGSSSWNGHRIHDGDPGTVPGQPASTSVKKLAQMINPFTPVGAKTFGTAPFTITPPAANDSSGTPVVVSIKSGPATMSGNTVTLTGIGTVVMAADQAASTLYNAAPEVTTSFIVSKGTAQVTFSNLNKTYNGTPQSPTVTTTPSGLAVTLKYGRSATAPTNAGTYAVTATVTNPNYTGTGTAALVIAKANATVHVSPLTVTFDGKAHPETATTTPAGLPVTFTYNGSATVPLHGGSYAVVATINSPNAQGSATSTVTINPAPATVTVTSATVAYTGKAAVAKATTVPARQVVTFTYNGSSTAPIAPGTYTVLGMIGGTDYSGSGSGTLTITPIAPLVVTGAASNIQSAQATLSATITPEDSSTSVQFKYGLSKTALTSTHAGSSVPAATTPGTSTATITGLTSGTIYYYSVTATNAGGMKTGAVKSFKTAP
jgi:sugar lactone lactonase YvrE